MAERHKLTYRRIIASIALGAVIAASAADPANAQKAQPQRFENWTYSCANGPCQIFVSLADTTTKEKKFSLAFVYDTKKQSVSGFLTMPLGVALPPGARIFTNTTSHVDWPYQVCNATGCTAIAVLEAGALDNFKSAEWLEVQFILYGKTEKEGFRFPMAGFRDALAKLIEGSQVQ